MIQVQTSSPDLVAAVAQLTAAIVAHTAALAANTAAPQASHRVRRFFFRPAVTAGKLVPPFPAVQPGPLGNLRHSFFAKPAPLGFAWRLRWRSSMNPQRR
jgi:hypothetical protein